MGSNLGLKMKKYRVIYEIVEKQQLISYVEAFNKTEAKKKFKTESPNVSVVAIESVKPSRAKNGL